MFTGIVEELGTVASRDGARLRINASLVLDDVQLGASIAVNGCCLTVVDYGSEDGDIAYAEGGHIACCEVDGAEAEDGHPQADRREGVTRGPSRGARGQRRSIGGAPRREW